MQRFFHDLKLKYGPAIETECVSLFGPQQKLRFLDFGLFTFKNKKNHKIRASSHEKC